MFCIVIIPYVKIQIFTQAVRPGFKFWLSFFPRSATNLPLVFNAYGSLLHVYVQHIEFTEVVIVKSQQGFLHFQGDEIMSKRTHGSRQTNTKGCYKRFRNGSSASVTTDQFRSKHFNLIKNQVILNRAMKGSNNLGYQFFRLINGILRSVIVFLDVIVNQVETQHKLTHI